MSSYSIVDQTEKKTTCLSESTKTCFGRIAEGPKEGKFDVWIFHNFDSSWDNNRGNNKGFPGQHREMETMKMDLFSCEGQREMFSIGQNRQKLRTRGTKEKKMRETEDVSYRNGRVRDQV